MGTATDMLIVVSTMYDNPQGLTKEEVQSKLSQIELSDGTSGLRRDFQISKI